MADRVNVILWNRSVCRSPLHYVSA